MAIQWRPFASFIIALPVHSLLISFWISLCRVRLKVLSQKRSRQVPETAPPPALHHTKWWLRWLCSSQAHTYKSAQGLHGAASRQVKEPHFSSNRCEKVRPLPHSQGGSKQRLEERLSEYKRTNEWMNKKGGTEERRKVRNWIWKGDMYSAVSHSAVSQNPSPASFPSPSAFSHVAWFMCTADFTIRRSCHQLVEGQTQ